MDLMGISDFARLSRLSPRALRLYDELGLLPPASVEPDSGYRWYSAGQLAPARLIAALRGIGMPLAQIRTVAGAERAAAAGLVSAFWAATEREHSGRRQLAAYLVDQLNGKRTVMYDVAVRDIPERSLLCLQRAASEQAEVFALGKEFIAILREHKLPQLDGPGGEVFLIYHGEVSADSDGPVEMCRPVPAGQAAQLAAAVPALT
jgi:DNA-binding transcriptional MerR regulator